MRAFLLLAIAATALAAPSTPCDLADVQGAVEEATGELVTFIHCSRPMPQDYICRAEFKGYEGAFKFRVECTGGEWTVLDSLYRNLPNNGPVVRYDLNQSAINNYTAIFAGPIDMSFIGGFLMGNDESVEITFTEPGEVALVRADAGFLFTAFRPSNLTADLVDMTSAATITQALGMVDGLLGAYAGVPAGAAGAVLSSFGQTGEGFNVTFRGDDDKHLLQGPSATIPGLITYWEGMSLNTNAIVALYQQALFQSPIEQVLPHAMNMAAMFVGILQVACDLVPDVADYFGEVADCGSFEGMIDSLPVDFDLEMTIKSLVDHFITDSVMTRTEEMTIRVEATSTDAADYPMTVIVRSQDSHMLKLAQEIRVELKQTIDLLAAASAGASPGVV
jgi:hypothetical protein